MENARSATAHSPGNAPKMAVEVRTILSYMVQIFPRKSECGKESNGETTPCSVSTATQTQSGVTSCLPCVSDVKGLLQISKGDLQPSEKSEKALVLCDLACSHSWISSELARKLDVRGTPTKLTVHGNKKVVDTQIVELKLTPVHSGGSLLLFYCQTLYARSTYSWKRSN